jgi:chitin disaccharide deacetylase
MYHLVSVVSAIALFVGLAVAPAQAQQPSLVERLGFPANTKVVIINGDDFGMNHATNEGTELALRTGGITSTTVMVPCPWFMEAVKIAKAHPQANVGVHTTLTSEWGVYKWGPVLGVAGAPSLCDEMGYFFRDVEPVYAHATVADADKEIRAQVDKALKAGIDVTHIDSHMGTMQYNPEYHKVYIKIAQDYKLPCRMAGRELMEAMGGGFLIDEADKMGVLHPDILFMGDPEKNPDREAWWKDRIAQAQAGKVTELYIHCGRLTPEMKGTTGSAEARTIDTDVFSSPKMKDHIKSLGIELISYRELRYLQREGKPMPRTQRFGWDE